MVLCRFFPSREMGSRTVYETIDCLMITVRNAFGSILVNFNYIICHFLLIMKFPQAL